MVVQAIQSRAGLIHWWIVLRNCITSVVKVIMLNRMKSFSEKLKSKRKCLFDAQRSLGEFVLFADLPTKRLRRSAWLYPPFIFLKHNVRSWENYSPTIISSVVFIWTIVIYPVKVQSTIPVWSWHFDSYRILSLALQAILHGLITNTTCQTLELKVTNWSFLVGKNFEGFFAMNRVTAFMAVERKPSPKWCERTNPCVG